MAPLIVELLGGFLLLLCAVHLFRVILTKIPSFWEGWFWLAPSSLFVLGCQQIMASFGIGGELLGALLLLVGAIMLTSGLWQWMPPAWWEKTQQNRMLKEQLEANRRMTMDALVRVVHTSSRLREMELLEERLTERMYKALHAAGNAVIVLDVEGRLVRWESGAQQMFGFKSSDVVGRPFQTLLSDPSQDEIWRVNWGNLTGKRTRILNPWVRLEGKRPTTVSFPFEIYLMKIMGGGEKTYYLGLLRDLTELEELTRAVNSYRQLVVEYRSRLREKERQEGLVQHRLTLIRQLWGRVKTKRERVPDSAARSSSGGAENGRAAAATPQTVEVSNVEELIAPHDSPDARQAAQQAITSMLDGLMSAGQPAAAVGRPAFSTGRPQGPAPTMVDGSETRAGGPSDDFPSAQPVSDGSDQAPRPSLHLRGEADGDQFHSSGEESEEVVVFNSIGPAKYVMLESFGKQTRFRKPRGMSLMILHHRDNLVISVGNYLGKMPERAVIPLSSMTVGRRH